MKRLGVAMVLVVATILTTTQCVGNVVVDECKEEFLPCKISEDCCSRKCEQAPQRPAEHYCVN